MRSIAIRFGIIGAIAIGAFVARPFLSGNAGDLKVGDCFDEPTTSSGVVEDVQHRPCTDAHDGEVIFTGDYAPAPDTIPTAEEFLAFYGDKCTSAFNAYTGIDFDTDTTYGMSAFRPTPEGWTGGDHEVTCYAIRLDGTKLSASIKKT